MSTAVFQGDESVSSCPISRRHGTLFPKNGTAQTVFTLLTSVVIACLVILIVVLERDPEPDGLISGSDSSADISWATDLSNSASLQLEFMCPPDAEDAALLNVAAKAVVPGSESSETSTLFAKALLAVRCLANKKVVQKLGGTILDGLNVRVKETGLSDPAFVEFLPEDPSFQRPDTLWSYSVEKVA